MYEEIIECLTCPKCGISSAIWRKKCNGCAIKLNIKKWEHSTFKKYSIC